MRAGKDLTPFLDARQNQLQLELAAAEGLDSKGLGVLASNLAIFIFIGQTFNKKLHDWRTTSLLIALGIAFVVAIVSVYPRKYAGASVSLYDQPQYANFSAVRLVKQLIGDTENAITVNRKLNNLRRWLFTVSLVITAGVSILLFVMLYFKWI